MYVLRPCSSTNCLGIFLVLCGLLYNFAQLGTLQKILFLLFNVYIYLTIMKYIEQAMLKKQPH